ncbi:hypothetical protein ACFX2C_014166 [Malus domestica]
MLRRAFSMVTVGTQSLCSIGRTIGLHVLHVSGCKENLARLECEKGRVGLNWVSADLRQARRKRERRGGRFWASNFMASEVAPQLPSLLDISPALCSCDACFPSTRSAIMANYFTAPSNDERDLLSRTTFCTRISR